MTPSPLRACPVLDTGADRDMYSQTVIPAKAGTREAAGGAIHEVAGEAIQPPLP